MVPNLCIFMKNWVGMKFIAVFIVTLFFLWVPTYAQKTTQDISQGPSSKNNVDQYYSIYPNPTNGSVQVTILSKDVDQFKLKIYNVQGIVIFDKFFKGAFKGLNLDLKLKKPGLYFLVIESGNHRHVEKVMVKS